MYVVFTGEEPFIVDARTNPDGHNNTDTMYDAKNDDQTSFYQ